MLLCILLVPSIIRAGATSDGNEYTIKAMFLLNFMKYIDWPIENYSPIFKIGVVGETEMYDALINLAAKRSSEGQKVEIKKVDSKNIGDFQIVFIANSERGKIDELIKRHSVKGVLIISEDDKGKVKQAGINLFNQEDKIRFEINLNSTKSNGLKVSSKLIELAAAVHN